MPPEIKISERNYLDKQFTEKYQETISLKYLKVSCGEEFGASGSETELPIPHSGN